MPPGEHGGARSGSIELGEVDAEWSRRVYGFLTETRPLLGKDDWLLLPGACEVDGWELSGITWEVRFSFKSIDPFADPLYMKPPRGLRAKLDWIWRCATWRGPARLPLLPVRYEMEVTLPDVALTGGGGS